MGSCQRCSGAALWGHRPTCSCPSFIRLKTCHPRCAPPPPPLLYKSDYASSDLTNNNFLLNNRTDYQWPCHNNVSYLLTMVGLWPSLIIQRYIGSEREWPFFYFFLLFTQTSKQNEGLRGGGWQKTGSVYTPRSKYNAWNHYDTSCIHYMYMYCVEREAYRSHSWILLLLWYCVQILCTWCTCGLS